jgi:hypothetical protein
VLVGVLVGEALVRPPAGAVRTAALEIRRIRDYLPRDLTILVAPTIGLLMVVLAATTAAGSPDDLGRPGRALVIRCSADLASRRGPWPGAYYSLPLALVVFVGVLAAGGTLWRIARRPRAGGEPVEVATDDGQRRQAATAVVGAVGVLVAAPLSGVCAIAAAALLREDCGPAWWRTASMALDTTGFMMVIVIAECLWAVLAPTLVPRPERAPR